MIAERGQGAPPVLAVLALALLIVFLRRVPQAESLSPVVMALNRALVYVTAAESARVGFSPALVFGCIALLCYLIGLSYAAKQENLREPRGFWPLAFMVLPFANVSALASPASWRSTRCSPFGSLTAFRFCSAKRRRNIKRAVGYLIAGISLLDACSSRLTVNS